MDELLSSIPLWAWIVIVVFMVTIAWHRRAKRIKHMPPPTMDLSLDPLETSVEATISVTELEREYAQRSAALEQRGEWIRVRIRQLQSRDHESLPLKGLLAAATTQERANLAAILKLPLDASAASLAEGLSKAGSHLVGSWLRGGYGVAYEEVVQDVASKLDIPKKPGASTIWEQERQILTATFNRMLSEASPEQQETILTALASERQGRALLLGTSTTLMVAAKLSGFALYTAASTTLAAVTSAVGLTLPFSVYIGFSSIIATLTGPFGWAALAVYAVTSLGGTNYKKTVPAVILVGTVRSRLIAERDQELQTLADEQVTLERAWIPLKTLRTFLDALGPGTLDTTDRKIPISDVPR